MQKSGILRIHFLHIGKTGGSAIKFALKDSLHTEKYEIHLHSHSVKLKDVPVGDKFFFFLRDPISRFVSGFYSRKRKGKPRYTSTWSKDEKIAFSRFSTPNQLARAISSNVPIRRKSATHAMRNIKHVGASYWDWFDCKNYFLNRIDDVLFIGFQETLQEDFSKLKRILDLPEIAGLPNDDILAHKNPKSIDTYLDDVALENLAEWFLEDYEFLGLCKEIVQYSRKPGFACNVTA